MAVDLTSAGRLPLSPFLSNFLEHPIKQGSYYGLDSVHSMTIQDVTNLVELLAEKQSKGCPERST